MKFAVRLFVICAVASGVIAACSGGPPGSLGANAVPQANNGLSRAGGSSDVVRALKRQPSSFDLLYTFRYYPPSGILDGATPTGPLVSDASGSLYGTTQGGGSYGCGTVFKLTPSGSIYSESFLYSFNPGGPPSNPCDGPNDGASPAWGVYMDSHGALYGTTQYGGKYCESNTHGCGTVYKLTPSGSTYAETILYNFQGPPNDGASPRSDVVADSKGNLYGTAGGIYGGVVFELKRKRLAYTESIIASNVGSPDYGNLLLVNDGSTIYGVGRGANGGLGNVFRLKRTTQGYTFVSLYSFKGAPDGANPVGTLVRGSRGIMYGATANGGAGGGPYGCPACGTVYSITPSGKERVLYSFKGNSISTPSPEDGGNPEGGVTIGAGGTLYGTTTNDGRHSCPTRYTDYCGTLYELQKSSSGSKWTETVLYRFGSAHYWTDGLSPFGELITDESGALYGTTSSGGYGNCLCGVVFKY